VVLLEKTSLYTDLGRIHNSRLYTYIHVHGITIRTTCIYPDTLILDADTM